MQDYPYLIQQTRGITYLYNAVGQKTTKTVTQGTTIIITDYLNGFQYKNAKLQFFPHAEGYVNTTASGSSTSYSFNYVFNFTDHLGNVRLSYSKDRVTEELKIIEENHYYPFGLKHEGYNSYQAIANKYKYNGKEYQDELGLNVYDYQARVYDPASVTFWQIDPKAEQGRRWSPYVFAMDNPVYYMDPDGMWPTDPVKGFIDRAKAYVRQKVAEKINEKVGEVKDFVVGYVNQKIDNGKKAVKDFFTIESSSTTKGKTSSDSGLGFGVDLKVKNKDNAQNGLVEKAKGDRNTNQVEIDEFLFMNQPGGSRGQTALTATEASENTNTSNSSSNTSTMENNTTSEGNEMIEVQVPKTSFGVYPNNKSATKFHSDTTIYRKDSVRVMDNAKNKQKQDTENFNKKYGTDF